eukprot:TRINITY_DN932_c0_g1_i3.p1 TRINITY_DN932_c0_g1~~TRINITY_DN932_c0_g1_i3.p1  ORF type:complete len:284 (+),score=62.65 TRINITY_DN932_c0_g1_i3:52-903(+)
MSDFEEDDWTPPTEAELKVLAAKRERSDKISKRMGDYLLKGYKMLASTCPICQTIELEDKEGQIYCVACQEIDCHETSKDDPVLNATAAEKVLAESQFSSRENRLESRNPDLIPGNLNTSHVSTSSSSSEGSSTISSQDNQENLNLSSVNHAAISSSNALSGLNVESLQGNGGVSQPGATVGAQGDAVGFEAPSLPSVLTMSSTAEMESGGGARPKMVHHPSTTLTTTTKKCDIYSTCHTTLVEKLHWANQMLAQETRVQQSDSLVHLIKSLLETIKVLNDVK